MFNLDLIEKKITQFTLTHQQTQTEIITLLKTQNLLLTQIKQLLEK